MKLTQYHKHTHDWQQPLPAGLRLCPAYCFIASTSVHKMPRVVAKMSMNT